MRIFFITEDAIKDGIFTITGTDVRHISAVLRYMVGDEISLVDENEREYRGVIDEINTSKIRGRIVDFRILNTEAPVDVTLVQGIPKGEKMDLIIQKSTELGVKRVIPVNTERSISRYEGLKAAKKVERWRRIAMEASKQSNRARIPNIDDITDLRSGLAAVMGQDLILIPWEMERKRGIRGVIQEAKEAAAEDRQRQGASKTAEEIDPADETLQMGGFHRVKEIERIRSITIIIGPEGGFSPHEIEVAERAGAILVSLGPRILRTETAGIALLSLIMYEFGGFDAAGGD